MISQPHTPRDLLAREREVDRVRTALSATREGHGSALVIEGEAGIGKTALLRYVCGTLDDERLVRVTGLEFEATFSYAALHTLCAPLMPGLDRLPAPQQEALRVVFGLADGAAPSRFLVGLAVMGLLSDAAEERPVLCVIDDAQWLDRASAQALAFVAHRLDSERITMVFALREPDSVPELVDLPRLSVTGLPRAAARTLLASEFRAPLDERVRERILAEARGNPLALLELPRTVGPTRAAGGFGLPQAVPLSRRIEESFERRLRPLPASTRTLLLIIAIEATGDAPLVWTAADRMGVGGDALAAAEAAGLTAMDGTVRFRHPLVGSVVYRTASPAERRRVHEVLSQSMSAKEDEDRRVWHRAQSAVRPDEDIAAELERLASRAGARGGAPAAAAFLEWAAGLTPDAGTRAWRALGAARAAHGAGDYPKAERLAVEAQAGPADESRDAQADLVRAQVAFAQRRLRDAPRLLLNVARRVAPFDAGLARQSLVDALATGALLGRHSDEMREALAAARQAPRRSGPPTTIDIILEGLLALLDDGARDAVPPLRRALADARDPVWLQRPALASLIAVELWEDEAYVELTRTQVREVRKAGALGSLSVGLAMSAAVAAQAGDYAEATALIAEEEALAEVLGASALPYPRLHLESVRGRASAEPFLSGTLREALERDDGQAIAMAQWALSVLHNGLANYQSALESARAAVRRDEPAITGLALIELVEAAVRCGETAEAADALAALRRRTGLAVTDWARGVEAYCTALTLGDDEQAEHRFRQAVDLLNDCRVVLHPTRARLVFGQWLRRAGRRREAREYLREALETFSAMGAEAYAALAARELSATGEHARRGTTDPVDQLTERELHIARLVATGATSKEIGVRLFLSPRTVDAHLRSIFRKLGITSRRQLRGWKGIG
ncbi:LuxR family transcriptional regulator [Streptomyces sp. NPDC013433]|uniref:LuxR family transcriptional regulator n=1 Tax=Streptomyces sp. NPDC013433 TaxID=3155604 RepID=UPI00345300BB